MKAGPVCPYSWDVPLITRPVQPVPAGNQNWLVLSTRASPGCRRPGLSEGRCCCALRQPGGGIAAAVAFLASPDASYITGPTLAVGGGRL